MEANLSENHTVGNIDDRSRKNFLFAQRAKRVRVRKGGKEASGAYVHRYKIIIIPRNLLPRSHRPVLHRVRMINESYPPLTLRPGAGSWVLADDRICILFHFNPPRLRDHWPSCCLWRRKMFSRRRDRPAKITG
ncbi:aBC transporter ATP-binding protein [Anopheles sinensis]|uniref:ABC transporter ATP-binding protein n=1 Tax=Anopheles sinensis TaxID=74873 RepID=A0A084W736_ANOSI|nr:aBC transporter ATP-binding protein [Anopheles sinensis]